MRSNILILISNYFRVPNNLYPKQLLDSYIINTLELRPNYNVIKLALQTIIPLHNCKKLHFYEKGVSAIRAFSNTAISRLTASNHSMTDINLCLSLFIMLTMTYIESIRVHTFSYIDGIQYFQHDQM